MKNKPQPQVVGVCGAADCGGPMLSVNGSVPRCERCQADPDPGGTLPPRSMAERLAAAERQGDEKGPRGPREVGRCKCGSALVVQPVLGAVVTCVAECQPRAVSVGPLGPSQGRGRPRQRDIRRGW